MTDPESMTAQQRAARALWLLQQSPMSTRQVADECGLSMQGARQMLHGLARVIPICYDRYTWWVDEDQGNNLLLSK